MKKRIMIAVLTAALMVSALFGSTDAVFAAPKGYSPKDRCGFKSPEILVLEDASDVELVEVEPAYYPVAPKKSGRYVSSVNWQDCDKYNNYFYYNKLSNADKATWDALDSLCMGFLNGSSDVASQSVLVSQNPNTYATVYYMNQAVEYNGSDVKGFYTLFCYANPQYYFLNSSNFFQSSMGWIIPIVYRDFVDVNARKNATTQMKANLDSILSQMPSGSDEAKAKWIFDYICTNVSYNYDALSNYTWAAEEDQKTQSLYSALVYKNTVCAGYALMYHAICNAAGIDAISVTSEVHAWNMMRISGAWVYVDTTWGDTNDEDASLTPDYGFFERNDSGKSSWDEGSSDEAHVAETIYGGYLETSVYDSANGDRLGSYPTQTVATPKVTSVKYTGNKVTLYVSTSTSKAAIYYTTNNIVPSIGQTKAQRVADGGSITVTQGQNISLLAYQSNWLDSGIYKVTYDSLKKNLSKPVVTLTNETGGVKISWKKISGASGYRVQRLVSGNKYKTLATVKSGTKTYVDTSVKKKNGSTYGYRVVAVGEGALVSANSATQKICRLTAPTLTSLKNVVKTSMQIQWKKNAKATGYEIKYVLGDKTKTAKIKNKKTLKTTIKKLKKNKTYKVYIRSYKKNSSKTYYSAWSSVKKVKIKK